jgi:hypothetical protein
MIKALIFGIIRGMVGSFYTIQLSKDSMPMVLFSSMLFWNVDITYISGVANGKSARFYAIGAGFGGFLSWLITRWTI